MRVQDKYDEFAARIAAAVQEIDICTKAIADCRAAARVLGEELNDHCLAIAGGKSIKATALRLLREAGPAGKIRAADIRETLARGGVQCHPKTIGMTLYRLAQDGEVVRSGWNWSIAA